MKKLIIILLLIPFNLICESEIGVISSLLYEYYQEPIDISLDNVPISKPLVSITPQFIWKDGRNLLLLNVELLGALGSLEGSFGKDGALSGQLKADSFYLGYIPGRNIYLKFGKYSSNNPFGFPVRVTTGQVESGYESEGIHLFSSIIFYSLFNEQNSDGSLSFKNERFNDDNLYIINSGIDFKQIGIGLRLPIELDQNYILSSFHPTLRFNKKMGVLMNDSFLGLSSREYNTVLGVREELSVYYNLFSTSLLLSYLSTNSNKNNGFAFTSIDNKDVDFHYGSHFNYLYQSCANIYGMTSFGIKQDLSLNNLNLWASFSGHLAIDEYKSENRQDTYIGSIFSLGLKRFELWSNNTLAELYASLFIPGGFSVINREQQQDMGIQLVLKLQHIIF